MRRCSSCWFWDPVELHEWGLCRLNAPRPAQSADGRAPRAVWPTTTPRDWCGDWSQRSPEQIAFDLEVQEAKDRYIDIDFPEGCR